MCERDSGRLREALESRMRSEGEWKRLLLSHGQDHLAPHLRKLKPQLDEVDKTYPGGVQAYLTNAKELLQDAKKGTNPLDGWTPSLPVGTNLQFNTPQFHAREAAGISEISNGGCAFVIVAGGLGERLGYSGIKVELPTEITTFKSYLELYAQSILALQSTGPPLPIAIMVSDDTAAKTEALLKANHYFGLDEDQVTLLKQEKVPCLLNNEAHLATLPSDPGRLLMKPHGHGDIHFLLHSSGLASTWLGRGVRWVYFMQDTNALAFRTLPAAVGVSVDQQLDVNSVCVDRTPGESIGGLMRLTRTNGDAVTANVEYNQIDALLRSTVEPKGDVAGSDGFSPFPGSINQIVFRLEPYVAQLKRTGGTMPEFVNPKYKDETKEEFKSPTRLECMMQDYPKGLPPSSSVGFTVVRGATVFSPVKTNLVDAVKKSAARQPTYSAASGEADVYGAACELLAACGVRLPLSDTQVRSGVTVRDTPRVVIAPSFGATLAQWRSRLRNPGSIRLAPRSTLVIEGDTTGVVIDSLDLDGALVVRACPGARIHLRRVRVRNKGWHFVFLGGSTMESEALSIRGYELKKYESRELTFHLPGDYVVDDGPVTSFGAIVTLASVVAVAILTSLLADYS